VNVATDAEYTRPATWADVAALAQLFEKAWGKDHADVTVLRAALERLADRQR